MKRAFVPAWCALLLVAPALAQPLEFDRFDQNHSTVGFTVPIMGGISEVQGKFTAFQLSIRYDESDVTKSTVEAIIDASTIDTGIPDRDTHLRSADFFDVASHPEIRFSSSSILQRAGQLVAVGTLEMRGVKRQVELPFVVKGPQSDEGTGKFILGVAADLKLNRQDYGISWRHDFPGFVGDEVEIRIRLISRLTDRRPPDPPASK